MLYSLPRRNDHTDEDQSETLNQTIVLPGSKLLFADFADHKALCRHHEGVRLGGFLKMCPIFLDLR